MYRSITDIIELLQGRTVFPPKKINFLLVREARNLLTSQLRAGKAKTMAIAEEATIDLIQEAYHANLALGIDTLRPNTLNINMREISNFVYIKKMGRLAVPREFWWIMRKIEPTFFRNMHVRDYIFFSDSNNIAVKSFDEPFWHHIRGKDILKRHNIIVESANSPEPVLLDSRRKVTEEGHRKIVELRKTGMSQLKIGLELDPIVTRYTVMKELGLHNAGKCQVC